MRVRLIGALETLCSALDAIPTWQRDGGRLRHFHAGWGCRLGIARRAVELDERWHTGVWQPLQSDR